MDYEKYITETLVFVAEQIEKEIAPMKELSPNEIIRTN